MDRTTSRNLLCDSQRFKTGVLIGLLLSVLPGFYPGITIGGDAMKEGHTILLTKQDSGKEIEVRLGDIIQIELQGMGAAGYKWHLQEMGAGCVRFVEEGTKVVSNGRLGAPVLGIWTFEVTRGGSIEIRMDHFRPWEGIGRSTDHFSVRLNIR